MSSDQMAIFLMVFMFVFFIMFAEYEPEWDAEQETFWPEKKKEPEK